MTPNISPWLTNNRSAWNASVHAWLTDVAATYELGQIESTTILKERPWSTVCQVTFTHHATYFKACSAAGHYEPNLLCFLQNQSILSGPKIIAVELEHKWILMRDMGVPIRTAQPELNQLSILCRALSDYAKLQISSIKWIDHLLEMGLPDRRLAYLPTLLDELLADAVIGVGRSAGEVDELRTAARKLLPKFERVCKTLDTPPCANALEHGDFHMSNLLVKDGVYSLIDWGDACITHPFCSILVTVEAALEQVPAPDKIRWNDKMRDAYLAPWQSHVQADALLHDFERAQWVAHVGRALDFVHMLSGADEETLNQWRPMIFDRLKMWVEAEILL